MFIKIGIKKTLLLLGLVTILLASFVFVAKTYALDEFIDDYTNENNVAVSKQVSRSVVYNAMELGWFSTSGKLYENYSAYIEVDVPLDRIQIQNNTNVKCMRGRIDETFYLYDDYGYGYFGNFSVDVDVLLESYVANARVYTWTVANNVGNWNVITDGLGIRFRFHTGSSNWQVGLGKKEGGVQSVSSILLGTGAANTWIYCTIIRNGASLTLNAYYDRARTNFWLTRSHVLANATLGYRFSYGLQSDNIGTSGRSITLYAMFLWYHNHWLNVSGYYDSGYFYTTEVLSALNNNSIVLLSNSTIPIGDIITVEFSNDNLTWVDHNGIAGSETLIAGFESIDIRDLSYTVLYMRFNYTDGGADSTPRLYQIRVITSDIISVVGGGSGAIGFIVASFILVPCLLVFWLRRKRRR